jgi:hypothetical protein
MLRKVASAVVAGALLAAFAAPGWAQQAAPEGQEGQKQIIKGPSKNSFGRLDLVLPEGSEYEVQYLPEFSLLQLRTITGEARIATSARYLILVESVAGPVEILVSNGRVITVEPGRSEIVGKAIVDDPGMTIIRINGTGPLVAQAGGGTPGPPEARVTVLEGVPAAALAGAIITPGPTGPTPTSVSPFAPPQ